MNDHVIHKKIIRLEKQNIYYNYTFLDEFKEYIDIEYIYESLQYINLKNIINHIYLKFILLKNELYKDKLCNEIVINNKINKIYKCDCKTFDQILKDFINTEYSICIFVVNSIIIYSS